MRPFTYSAAVAYYAIFSLPALLIVITSIGALAFSEAQVEREVLGYVNDLVGPDVARSVKEIVARSQEARQGWTAILIGLGTLLFAASGVFIHLQEALNQIWGVELKKSAGFVRLLKARLTALGMLISIGFLLLISLALTALLTLATNWLAGFLPGALLFVLSTLHFAVSLGAISVLFALIFKILPDIKLGWKAALKGGIVTALLFLAGEYGLSVYFDMAEPESAFGAAGSLILLMLWTSYSTLILLFGAQFTREITCENGGKAEPTDIAEETPRTP